MWQTLSCMQQGVLRVQTRSCAVRAHATAFCCHGGCVTCSVLLEMNCGVIEKFSNCWPRAFWQGRVGITDKRTSIAAPHAKNNTTV